MSARDDLLDRYPALRRALDWPPDWTAPFAPELEACCFSEVERCIAQSVEAARDLRADDLTPKHRAVLEHLLTACADLARIESHFVAGERAQRISRDYGARVGAEARRFGAEHARFLLRSAGWREDDL